MLRLRPIATRVADDIPSNLEVLRIPSSSSSEPGHRAWNPASLGRKRSRRDGERDPTRRTTSSPSHRILVRGSVIQVSTRSSASCDPEATLAFAAMRTSRKHGDGVGQGEPELAGKNRPFRLPRPRVRDSSHTPSTSQSRLSHRG